MKTIARAIFAAIFSLLALAGQASAQSNPGLRFGQVPTAAQWNSYFSAKQDYLGFTPLNPSSVAGASPIIATIGGGVVTLSCPSCASTSTLFANPSATIGLTVINGVATTAMRSDAAPPLSSAVQSALTGTNHAILLGTGAFGVGSAGPCARGGAPVYGTGVTVDPICSTAAGGLLAVGSNAVGNIAFNYGTALVAGTGPLISAQYGSSGSLAPGFTSDVLVWNLSSYFTSTGHTYVGLNIDIHASAGADGAPLGAKIVASVDGTWTQTGLGAATAISTQAFSTRGGYVFGGNAVANCATIACTQVIGTEINVNNSINGTATEVGLQIVKESASTGTITTNSVGLLFINQASALGWSTAVISIGGPGGIWPATSAATLILSAAGTADKGIDFSASTLTTAAFKSNGFLLNGSGAITAGSWTATKIGLAFGGTNADLSATGGASQVLKQVSSGAAVTVARLACADLSDAGAGCTGGSGTGAITVLTGDVTATGPGSVAATIAVAAVTYAKFQDIAGLSLHGRSASTSGVSAAITGTANQIPIVNNAGTSLAFVTVSGDLTNVTGAFTIAANAVTLAKLATQATNTVLGNATAGTAVPTALAIGTCSTAASALIWTTNTGFGCNTSITAAAVAVGGITGLGTGVATALAVNVGSAGAFVTFNGALGTPSSGTVTNLTGTASININGAVGATSQNTGQFTSVAYSTTLTGTSANASAIAVGRLGATTPAFQVDASTATSITGIKIKSAASGGGVAVSAIGETNVNLTIDAAGSGTIIIAGTSTGAVTITPATTITGAASFSSTITGTSTNASALAVGRLGATTPAFSVDASAGTQTAGLKVTGAALNGTVAVVVTDTSGNTNLTINALGSGTIGIGSVSTGAVTFSPQSIFNIARTIASATAAVIDDIKVSAATTTITGNTGTPITKMVKVGIYQPTLTDSSAVTVSNAATLYVDNAPLAAGSVTMTKGWAMLIGTGGMGIGPAAAPTASLAGVPAAGGLYVGGSQYGFIQVADNTNAGQIELTVNGVNQYLAYSGTLNFYNGSVLASLTSTGILNVSGTTDASSATTGIVTVTGGLGVAKSAWIGTYVNVGTKIRAAGTAPALTSCGTGSPTISGSDLAGEVVLGTAATGCIITFNVAYAATPYCTVTWQTTPGIVQTYTVSTTAITLAQTSASGDKVNYTCMARSGG